MCVECGTRSEDGAGWRAEVVIDVDGHKPDEVVIYCPGCWQFEFGSMPESPLTWLLWCGHAVPLLEHERPKRPPHRPRMCPICQRLRNVETER